MYQKKKNNLEHIQKLLIIIGHIGIFGVLVWCTANQIITVGVFAALATSLGELFEMAEEILSVIAEGVSEELEKIRNYFKMIEDIESGTDSGAGGARLEDLASIDFEQVSFRYPGAPQNALEDISFHIDKGDYLCS